MNWKIPLFKIYSDDEDIEAVARVIRRGTYWANGPEITEFEGRIAEFLGVKYALVFNSGTSALHTLLLAHNIKGKEVIIPSFTFIATANSVILAGGRPVFAESEDETFGLDAKDVEKRISSNTAAIVLLHYGGFPSRDAEELARIAKKHNLLLIEDAAESYGARISGRCVGTFGDSAIFSFCQNKIVAIGEGGVIVTNSQDIYEKAKLLRSHGRVEHSEDYFSSTKDNDYIEPGYNFRMPSICAALGISQLNKMGRVIELRRKHAHYLNSALSGVKEIKLMKEIPNHYQVHQMYTIMLPNKEIRDKLQSYLSKNGIMTKIYFEPVHLKTLYRKMYSYKEGDLPKTEMLSERVITLPLYPKMSKEDLDYIIKTIYNFFNHLG